VRAEQLDLLDLLEQVEDPLDLVLLLVQGQGLVLLDSLQAD
jgi:hypothetical protein